MSEVFIISDPHFGHENVIRFGDRPFKDADEMTEVMVERWNNKVGKRDTVICLGDWGMSANTYKITDRLNGMIRLVMGNHDSGNIPLLAKSFYSVHGSLCKYDMLMTHIPIMFDDYHHYDWILHGHIHHANQNIKDYRYINANMDVWNYTEGDEYSPIPLDDIKVEMRMRKLANWKSYVYGEEEK